MLWLAALVTGLGGCAGDPPADGADTDLPGDDTDPSGDDIDGASVVVTAALPSVGRADPQTSIDAMFVQPRAGIHNLAQCVGAQSFCVTEWPTVPDAFVLVQDYAPTVLSGVRTLYVGDAVTLGPWSASWSEDPSTGLGSYSATVSGVLLPDDTMDLQFDGGDWDGYRGSSDISAPTHMDVTNFDPMLEAVLYDSEPTPLRWVPDPDNGEVHLVVRTPAEDRLYLLEDDGAFDLDLTSVGLQNGDAIELLLGRWTRESLDLRGGTLELVVQSSQRIAATWRAIGPQVELTDLHDTCAQAEVAAPVEPGNYRGDSTGFADDLDPAPTGCTGFHATGADAIVPLELMPDELLEVTYTLPSDDASVYLLTDCNTEESCVTGRDGAAEGATERLEWLNATGAPARVYLVLDAFDAVTAPFDLTIAVTSLGTDILVPTCFEAIQQGPIATGQYVGSIGGNVDYLDPACANGAAGGEGLAQIFLQAGQALTAEVFAPGGADVKLYLLSNCAIADSCFAVGDAEAGAHEQLLYTNTGASSAFFYLVLDGDTNPDEYLLDVVVQ